MLQEFAIAAFFGYFFGASISNPLLLLFFGIHIAWIASIGTNHEINSFYLTGVIGFYIFNILNLTCNVCNVSLMGIKYCSDNKIYND